MRRSTTAVAAIACALALLSGCGSDDPESGPVGSGTQDDPIAITVEGGKVSPSGERVEAETGTVHFEVTSDAPGVLGIHTEPEVELEFGEGTTTLEATLEQPGVYEVETHDPDVVVVQLEVR